MSSDKYGYIALPRRNGRYERGLDGFDPNCSIAGLEYALHHINRERAAFIWNSLLVTHAYRVSGEVESCPRKSFDGATRENRLSTVGQLVCSLPWLPDREGTFHQPNELTLDDLPSEFIRDEALAAALGMRSNETQALASKLGIDPADIDMLLRHREAFVQWKESLLARERSGRARNEEPDTNGEEPHEISPEPLNYREALEAAFRKLGTGVEADEHDDPGPVPDPHRRALRIHDEILDSQRNEPKPEQRFRKVPTRVWEAKDSSTRSFLLHQYGGRCQICAQTFRKRDGTPYFEGLYLVPASKARWVDRPGNVLCLCPTCCAKFLFGPVEAENILDQILGWRDVNEGMNRPQLQIRLCGAEAIIQFSERHMIELREIVHAAAEVTI